MGQVGAGPQINRKHGGMEKTEKAVEPESVHRVVR